VLSAILEKEPETLGAVQPTTPPTLDYSVRTCLEKNPEDRFQTAHDVKLQLMWIARTGSQASMPAPLVGKPRTSRTTLGWAGILPALVLAVAAGWWGHPQAVRHVTTASLLAPEGAHFASLYRNGPPAISPDGTRMAFITSREGKPSLWLRPL